MCTISLKSMHKCKLFDHNVTKTVHLCKQNINKFSKKHRFRVHLNNLLDEITLSLDPNTSKK